MPALPAIDSLWNYEDPAATEQQFLAILPEASGDPPYHVELLSQLARTHSLRDQFAAAHAYLDQADALLALHPGAHRALARVLLERGRTHNSAGERERALATFETTFELAREHHFENLGVDAAHMIAIAYPDPAQQREWNLGAMELATAATDPVARRWLAPLHNNLGWTCHDAGDYPGALHHLQQALAAYQSRTDPASTATALFIARWSVAKLLRLNDRPAEAREILLALQTDMEARNDPDGFVYEELAELALDAQDPAAPALFARAHMLLKDVPWLQKADPPRLARLAALAQAAG